MGGLSFNFTVTGIDEVINALDDTKDVLNDLEPEFTAVGDYLIQFFENDVFESEGSVYGNNWQELSPSYEEWKNKNYPGRGILERTGTLRYSFQAIPTSDYLIISNPTSYGVFHEYGTSKMPQRAFMILDSERQNIIRDMMIESLNNRIKDAIG